MLPFGAAVVAVGVSTAREECITVLVINSTQTHQGETTSPQLALIENKTEVPFLSAKDKGLFGLADAVSGHPKCYTGASQKPPERSSIGGSLQHPQA